MRKLLFISFAVLFPLVFVPTSVFADTAGKKPVSFRVEVGNLVCKDGIGTASVLFATEPKEGGSYEIIGDALDRNSITLDRRVVLKSGTYTWKGFVNEGYYEIPPSIGEFTVPLCGEAPVSPPALVTPIKTKTATTERTAPTKEEVSAPANQQEISVSDVENSTGNTVAGASSSAEKQEGGSDVRPGMIIAGLALLGLAIGFFGWKKKGDKAVV